MARDKETTCLYTRNPGLHPKECQGTVHLYPGGYYCNVHKP